MTPGDDSHTEPRSRVPAWVGRVVLVLAVPVGVAEREWPHRSVTPRRRGIAASPNRLGTAQTGLLQIRAIHRPDP